MPNIFPPAQPLWQPSSITVNGVGQSYQANDTVRDVFGGAYTVGTVDSLGRVLTLTVTATGSVEGPVPSKNVPTFPVSVAAGGNGLTLYCEWAQTSNVATLLQPTWASGTSSVLTGSAIGAYASGAAVTGSVPGLTTGMSLVASPNINPGNRLQWQAYCSAAGVATVVVTNPTSGSITPATGVTFNLRAFT